MRMIAPVGCGLLALAAAMLSLGCVDVNARVPDIQIGGGGNDRNGVSQIPHADPNDQSAQARANRQLREYIAGLNDQLKDARKKRDKADDRIEDLEEKIEDLEDKIKDLKKDLDKVEDQRDEYKKQRDRYKDALDD